MRRTHVYLGRYGINIVSIENTFKVFAA